MSIRVEIFVMYLFTRGFSLRRYVGYFALHNVNLFPHYSMTFHDTNSIAQVFFVYTFSRSTFDISTSLATRNRLSKSMAPNWTGYFPHGWDVASQSISVALESAKNNPAMAGIIALGTSGLTIVAMPAVVATPVIGALHWAGFGVGGIIGGLWHL
jgi:hypothetical protein